MLAALCVAVWVGGVQLTAFSRRLFPGVAAALVVASVAIYLAGQYSAPVMLFALLIGMAMNFLSRQDNYCPGINFAASYLLRIGVALLGLRITFAQVTAIGAANLVVLAAGVFLTIAVGVLLARLLRRSTEFGVLTGGAVAICGASAALAIASMLPSHPDRERQLVFTVLSVTTLSTIAMVAYPVIIDGLGLSRHEVGLFLGATIHDVAQVVGAGYSVSSEVGDFATITKLFRVLMLLPVFAGLLLLYRPQSGVKVGHPFPWFLLGFVACLLLASSGVLPQAVLDFGVSLSTFLLVTAIAALGMKTQLSVLLKGSAVALALVVGETIFLAAIILGWLLI